jgi:sulfatase modifying factor 1
VSALGGASSAGHLTATGGTATNTGGTTSTGGTTATGGTSGAGCTGSFESIQNVSGHNLCVAKLVTVTAPSGSSDYQIDATEVTRGQYEGWLATDPALPAAGDAACGWKSSGSYVQASSCMTSSDVCQGTGCDHYPVVCVDWCDAYHYCAAVGKRLCGRIGGGSNAYSSYTDAGASQWYRACSSGGANTYPYGNTYQSSYCNGPSDAVVAVGTMTQCQSTISGYTGVYDLSGNVWEWEDSCNDTTGQSDQCRLRGGSKCVKREGYAACCVASSGYSGCTSLSLECDHDASGTRSIPNYDLGESVGFRCCSP